MPNFIHIDGLPVYDAPGAARFTNYFEMHTGAGRYGHGQFLMLRGDYANLNKSAPVTLKMEAVNSPGIAMQVVVAGATPFSSVASGSPGARNENDLVIVTVFDLRHRLMSPATMTAGHADIAFNVIKEGAPYVTTGTKFFYYDSTLLSGAEYTWAQVLTKLEAQPWPGVFPDWKPRNLIFDGVSFTAALDRIAGIVRCVVGFDWSASGTAGLIGFVPGDLSPDNTALLDDARTFIIGGRATEKNLARLPKTYVVYFPGRSSGDPYFRRAYAVPVDVNAAGTGKQTLHMGEYPASFKTSAIPENQAELDDIADSIAQLTWLDVQQEPSELEYAGIWNFKPDGAIRGILWVSDGRGARTTLRQNNDRDFAPLSYPTHGLDTDGQQLVEGLGPTVVAFSNSGTRLIAGPVRESVEVRVDQDAPGNAKYFGWRLVPPTGAVDDTTALTQAQCGSPPLDGGSPGDYDVLICNLDERDKSTHDLTMGTPQVTDFVGYTFNRYTDDGKLIVYINGLDIKDCSSSPALGVSAPTEGTGAFGTGGLGDATDFTTARAAAAPGQEAANSTTEAK